MLSASRLRGRLFSEHPNSKECVALCLGKGMCSAPSPPQAFRICTIQLPITELHWSYSIVWRVRVRVLSRTYFANSFSKRPFRTFPREGWRNTDWFKRAIPDKLIEVLTSSRVTTFASTLDHRTRGLDLIFISNGRAAGPCPTQIRAISVMGSRVENRRSDCSLPVVNLPSARITRLPRY
jgi:hypothetical protein